MEGVIQEINKGALELFGYNKDELIGKKRVSIFSPGEIVIQNVLGWLEKANKEGKSLI
jgi:PAS domain S-box-containing protein